MLQAVHADAPVLNRAMRRMAKKKPPARKYNDKTAFNPVVRAVIEADFKVKFSTLKRDADQHCIAGEDVSKIIYTCGFLLFVTIRALELDQYDIEDADVVSALEQMGDVLGDMRLTEALTLNQRKVLMDGMDYLDALIQALSKEAIAIAWWQVDQASQHEGVGTNDLTKMLEHFKK